MTTTTDDQHHRDDGERSQSIRTTPRNTGSSHNREARALPVSFRISKTNGLSGAPLPPDGLGSRGRRFWVDLVAEFEETSVVEVPLLLEACRTLDLLEELQAVVAEQGPTLKWGDGVRANPAAVEARQQRLVLSRLLAALAVPPPLAEDELATRSYRRRRSA